MVPSQIFILLAVFDIILFCAGFLVARFEGDAQVGALFLSAFVSFYLGLACHGGISFDSSTWANGYVGLFFVAMGVFALIFAIVKSVQKVQSVLQDPDWFEKRGF